jgi:hypothetical protein
MLSIQRTPGHVFTFKDTEVREVQQRIPDSNVDGALIGLAVGWLPAAIYCSSISDSSETSPCFGEALIYGGLPGLGIGIIVDSFRQTTVTLYRAGNSGAQAGITILPIVTATRKGMALQLRF